MNFLAIGISLVIVLVSVLFAPKEEVLVTKSEEVLSATPATSEEPKSTSEESFTTVSVTPAPTNIPDFQYPGSKSDGVDKITNWYKEEIKQEGYNATSFVTTKTNGKVLNKLVGAKAGSKVEVVISQSDTSSPVEVSVNFE